LKCNLFSVKAAATKGNVVKFGKTNCWMSGKNGVLFGTGKVVDRLYYLDCHATVQDHATVAARPQFDNTEDLWHQSLGHLNGGQLREMATLDMVKV